MVLNTAGIAAGWAVESMPQARVMPNAILLPDGRVLLVNGAQTGVAGYQNARDHIGFCALSTVTKTIHRLKIRYERATQTIQPLQQSSTTRLPPQAAGSQVPAFRHRLSRVYTTLLRV
jgi:hypothetical protein